MIKVLTFLWNISLLVYLVILLLVYAYMPESVAYQADELGNYAEFVSKDTFFYTILIGFVISNAIFYFFRRTMEFSKKSAGFFGDQGFKETFLSWFLVFKLSVNALFIFTTIFLGIFNNQEDLNINQFDLLAYLGPSLVVLSLLILIILLAKRVGELSGKAAVENS